MPIFLGDEMSSSEYEELIEDMDAYNALHEQSRQFFKAHRLAQEKMVEEKQRAEIYADAYYRVQKQMEKLKAKIEKGHEQIKGAASSAPTGGC